MSKIFEVFVKSDGFPNRIHLDDVARVALVKQGFRLGYFASVYNVILAFMRGFFIFGICLMACEAILFAISTLTPWSVGLVLHLSFSFFVGSFGSDVELFFLKRRKFNKLTDILAKNQRAATENLYLEFLPKISERIAIEERAKISSAGLSKMLRKGGDGLAAKLKQMTTKQNVE
jgi:hypothetical protein